MCGISGIISIDNSDQSNNIRELNKYIPHRGPDNESYFAKNNVYFGHKRLSIIDLSDAAHQPFCYNELSIIFNGEVYNYIEVREELIKLGHSFNTGSDTEVVLKAYLQWGDNCVNKFNGMWSLAIFDPKNKRVFCSRDRFGVKPFYYLTTPSLFAFASEIKQLVLTFKKTKVNFKTLVNFLVAGLEDYSENTFFNDVKQLEPGHNLVFDLDSGTFKKSRYYDLKLNKEYSVLKLNEAKEIFKSEFDRSIKYRLRSDVKIGTCLSGGLDSSAVAAIASEQYFNATGKNFLAFTASSIDPANDEYAYAKMVADKFHIDWKVVKPDTNSFKSVIDKVIYHLDEPFASPSIFMQYFVMQIIKNENCTVVLDGQGGDETFLGYERYFPLAAGSIFSPLFWKKAHQISKNSKLSYADVFKYKLYFTNHKLRTRTLRSRNSFLKKSHFDLLEDGLLKDLAGSYKNIYELQHYEITKTQLPHLLKYEDRNSMCFSIEARLPFLDYQLVEFAYSLPIELKLDKGWTKKIIRDSLNDTLPAEIAWRKNKIGFEAPKSIWLNELNDIKETISGSRLIKELCDKIPVDFNDLNQLWKFYNIARWEQIYNVTL